MLTGSNTATCKEPHFVMSRLLITFHGVCTYKWKFQVKTFFFKIVIRSIKSYNMRLYIACARMIIIQQSMVYIKFIDF